MNVTLPDAGTPPASLMRAISLTGLPDLGDDTANVVDDTSSASAVGEGSGGVDAVVGSDVVVGGVGGGGGGTPASST